MVERRAGRDEGLALAARLVLRDQPAEVRR